MSEPAAGPSGEALLDWLRFRALPGMGDRRRRELLSRYGTPGAVLAAPAAELGEKAAAGRASDALHERARRGAAELTRLGAAIVTEGDPRYPQALLELPDPPCVLFAVGRLDLLDRPAVAVVGSREHTEYGAEAARLIAAELAASGVVVVSGLARGIDAHAHEAALAGGTVAVLGCGVDVIYPHANAGLYRRIAAEGLLLSEFPPGEPALRYNFPQRNRLIAALSQGVVVVEASAKSGSLITAEHAMDLGRDVFAVPGPIGRRTSAGTNALIRDGAALVACAADVLDALGLCSGGAVARREPVVAEPPLLPDGAGRTLWDALGDEPTHVDDLAGRCGLAAPVAIASLLELELVGAARQLPGMRYIRG